jgi:ribose/xylose/arabinose/galactoside ABC-type transport system permease subunit
VTNSVATATSAIQRRLAGLRLGKTIDGFGLSLVAVIVAECVFFSLQSPYFLQADNLANIGRAIAIIGVAAVGETIVVISGGFDLSVGSTMAAAGMLSAYLVNHGANVWLSFGAALMLGLAIGIANGSLVCFARINPLIATLATLAVVRGLGFVITGGEDLVISDQTYLNIGTNSFLAVPWVVWLLIGSFVAFGAVMPRSKFGRYTYAIGSSLRASKLSGVPINRWRMAFYATCGLLAALAGLITVARTGTASPSANTGVELDVFTAVFLGGASLTGGRGRLGGTFLALVLLGVLNNGLILVNVAAYWQQVVKGLILIAAVSWDELHRTRRDVD